MKIYFMFLVKIIFNYVKTLNSRRKQKTIWIYVSILESLLIGILRSHRKIWDFSSISKL